MPMDVALNLFKIKRNEISGVGIIFSLLLLYTIAQIILFTILRSYLIQKLGIEFLPYHTLISVAVTVLTSWALIHYGGKIEIVFTLMGIALVSLFLVAELFLGGFFSANNGSSLLILFFLFSPIITLINNRVMLLVNLFISIHSPSQVKRLNPFVNNSLVLGAIFGSGFVNFSLPIIGFTWLSITAGVIALFSFIAEHLYHNKIVNSHSKAREFFHAGKEKKEGKYKELLNATLSSPVLRSLLVYSAFLSFFLDTVNFKYTYIINKNFDSPAAAAHFFSAYDFFSGIPILLFQFFAISALISWMGVSKSRILRPFTLTLFFGLLLIHSGVLEVTLLRFFSDLTSMVTAITISMINYALPMETRFFARTAASAFRPVVSSLTALVLATMADKPEMLTWICFIVAFLGLIYSIRDSKTYLNVLIGNLKNTDKAAFIDTLELLEEAKEPIALKSVSEFLRLNQNMKDNKPIIKAMEVFGKMGRYTHLRPIVQYLYHPDPQLRYNAILTIEKILTHKTPHLVKYYFVKTIKHLFYHDSWGPVKMAAGRFLFDNLPENAKFSFLEEILEDKDVYRRIFGIQMLSQIEDLDMFIFLHLDDPEPSVQSESIVALWPIEDSHPLVDKHLAKLLESNDQETQKFGFIALCRIDNAQSLQPFLEELALHLVEQPPHLQKAVASLAGIKHLPIEQTSWKISLRVFCELLTDPHISLETRREFVDYLRYLPDALTDEIFAFILTMPKDKQVIATESLKKVADLYSEDLLSEDISSAYGLDRMHTASGY